MSENVILVDQRDNEIGVEEKMQAHKEGKLHRAFSVFIFNSKGEMLLQQRAHNKYHSGGLWTNTCCSHPRQGESVDEAAHRRLEEEMGFDCDLNHAFHFIYNARLDNELTENELDHVFIGYYDGVVNPDKNEVESFKWMNLEKLTEDMDKNPQNYTVWFKIAINKVFEHITD